MYGSFDMFLYFVFKLYTAIIRSLYLISSSKSGHFFIDIRKVNCIGRGDEINIKIANTILLYWYSLNYILDSIDLT